MFKSIIFAVLVIASNAALANAEVSDAYVRALIPGKTLSAGFFVFENTTSETIELVGAASNSAATVEMHNHIHEDGMMKMRKVSSISLAPGEKVTFQPGGYHLMMFNCDPEVFKSGRVVLQLVTASGKTYTVNADVRSPHQMHH